MNYNLREIYDALNKEVILLHSLWISYNDLYGKKEERIRLLNSSASFFFYQLQFLFLDEIELIISKLLDPADQRTQSNLSLQQLFGKIDNNDLVQQLNSILCDLQEKTRNIRKRRNKRLGHFDLNISVKRSAKFFTKSSRKEINGILSEIDNFMNVISSHYFGSITAYEHFSALGNAESLINCLKRSESYKILEKQGKIEHGFWRVHGPFKDD